MASVVLKGRETKVMVVLRRLGGVVNAVGRGRGWCLQTLVVA